MDTIAPISTIDRTIIEMVLIILNCGREETLGFLLLYFVDKGIINSPRQLCLENKKCNYVVDFLSEAGRLPKVDRCSAK